MQARRLARPPSPQMTAPPPFPSEDDPSKFSKKKKRALLSRNPLSLLFLPHLSLPPSLSTRFSPTQFCHHTTSTPPPPPLIQNSSTVLISIHSLISSSSSLLPSPPSVPLPVRFCRHATLDLDDPVILAPLPHVSACLWPLCGRPDRCKNACHCHRLQRRPCTPEKGFRPAREEVQVPVLQSCLQPQRASEQTREIA